jgi:benzoyl-CoA reductase/2-hydroxyglutaryl-CoA dehydratase subunit BcrC/BadD/HgdB
LPAQRGLRFLSVHKVIALESLPEEKRYPEKSVGWFCAYTPLELISAAGLEPVRLFGAPGVTPSADSILGTNMCPYVRACLEQGLAGPAPRAVVVAGCCDNLRRLYDAWTRYCDSDFTYLFDVPRERTESAVEHYLRAIRGLAGALEEYTGQVISNEELVEAIRIRREAEGRLALLCEAQSRPDDRLESEAYMRRFIAEQAHHTDLPGEGTGTRRAGASRKPVVVTGNIVRQGRLLEMIDSCGGVAVALDLCSADRFVTWDQGSPAPEPEASRESLLALLARTYLARNPCPRMFDGDERHQRLVEDCGRLGARGVIVVPLMFCDPFLYDLPALQRRLDEAGIPSLVLNSDYIDDNLGQVMTRVEAFMEMI